MPTKYGIIIHGGAGDSESDEPQIMKKIIDSSCTMLKNGTSAVNVAEHAVLEMEDSGEFNAGIGSCLTEKATIEMDAGIMDGSTMNCGGIGAISHIKNPTSVARKIMSNSAHSLIVGNGGLEFALSHGFKKFEITPNKAHLEKLEKIRHRYGTVGAVVMDSNLNIAAAVSTGGIWSKSPGRVGDSAIVGSGYYAKNNAGGAVATGDGDIIMKSCITKNVCDMLDSGINVKDAVNTAIKNLKELGGRGGVIAISSRGEMASAFNTKMMFYRSFLITD